MEEKNLQIAPIVTVVYPDGINLSNVNEGVVKNIDNSDGKENSTEDCQIVTAALEVQDDKNKSNEDDHDSFVIEEEQSKTIELDDDSNEETEVTLENGSKLRTNDPFNKPTEFVIVNAANTSETEVADAVESKRCEIDDVNIKDELAETITADLNTNDVLENDPMDLLELNTRSECTSSTISQPDTEDYGDDGSSIGSSSVQTGSSFSMNVNEWAKDYPWLLYEDGEDIFGYCLYCDAKINIKSHRSVKQHGLSLYHKERCENYLAFRDEEEKNGLSTKLVEIKEEFGTDSRVEALKLKRKSQSVALNNFNWRRWLEEFSWLERDSTEGTIGYCKYCLIHVNVEFSYLRDRHQESSKHRESEKQYEEKLHDFSNEQNVSSSIDEEKVKESSVENNQTKRWLELVENEPSMVRCKICGTKMFKNNFLRHLRTNLHDNNEKIYLQNQNADQQNIFEEESDKNQQNWKIYAKHHAWLVPDPTAPAFAYCKYCEKRIIYGASAAKRALHENSSQHKQNEIELKKRSRKSNNSDKENYENASEITGDQNDDDSPIERNVNEVDEDEEDQNDESEEGDDDDEKTDEDESEEDDGEEDDGEGEQEEDEQEESQVKESEDENDSKKRVYRLTEEWLNQYSWSKKYNKDPRNFYFCIYCKIPLRAANSRSKHQKTSFHISAEKEFLDRETKKQKQHERKHNNEISSFEWAIPLRNNPSSYSCRYCRVRISKNYSKKQHASSKIHQINESIYKNNRRKSLRKEDHSKGNDSQPISKVVTQLTNIGPSKKVETYAKVVIKAPSTVTLIKQWQKKFPWLSYKRSELRSNYGHCKLCESSLYIRSLKHVLRHLRSSRHISITRAKKKEKLERDRDQDVAVNDKMLTDLAKKGPKEELQTSSPHNQTKQQTTEASREQTVQTTESRKAFNYKSTIVEMKKRFSWIEKAELANNVFCRFCNINIPLKILFLRNHSNSQKHRRCVINYRINKGQNNKESEQIEELNKHGDDGSVDDVMIVEENNEEILISEQDENWTIKSETMDEHEELDYLLQRSFNNQRQSNSNIREAASTEDEPPTKRIKKSQSLKRINDNNTSLVASLLSTPLTLASCLGPLIQQQIQQQANISQTSLTNSTPLTPPATVGSQIVSATVVEPENTYDLFFKSISETIKKLPVDLAAEGKLRVMQIICDLELQALRRQQSAQNESFSGNTSFTNNAIAEQNGTTQQMNLNTVMTPPATSLASTTQTIPNTSSSLNHQMSSTTTVTHGGFNRRIVHDNNVERNRNSNETIITHLNLNSDMSPKQLPSLPSSTQLIPKTTINSGGLEQSINNNDMSPIIGVMDKNGLQTIHLKTPVTTKQMPRTTNINPNTNSGIRCIPFKNLSQSATSDSTTPPNTKLTRLQVPMTVTSQSQNPNINAMGTSKNLINFRNIQIKKRIGTPPTVSASGITTHQQQTVSHTSSVTSSKSPQRTYISLPGVKTSSATTTTNSITVNQGKEPATLKIKEVQFLKYNT